MAQGKNFEEILNNLENYNTEFDVHKSKRALTKLIQKIAKNKESTNKDLLLIYASWHIEQVVSDRLTFASAKRSLEIANAICEEIPNLKQLPQKQIEDWWEKQLNRNSNIKSRTGVLKNTGKKLSRASLSKINSQALKLFKFISFLEKDKSLSCFKSYKCKVPDCAEFLVVPDAPKKQKEDPTITQEQVKQIIDWLKEKDKTNSGKAAAALISLLNDCGFRFGEAITLKNKNIDWTNQKHLTITLSDSKTKTRTVVSVLAKDKLKAWIDLLPNGKDPNAFIFSTKKGTLYSYTKLSGKLKEALKALNLPWKQNQSLHYFRHLFASRTIDWTDSARNYWLGWEEKGMIGVYAKFGVEQCKKYYFDMIKDNPMLNEPLSFADEQIQQIEQMQEKEAEQKIIALLKKEGLLK